MYWHILINLPWHGHLFLSSAVDVSLRLARNLKYPRKEKRVLHSRRWEGIGYRMPDILSHTAAEGGVGNVQYSRSVGQSASRCRECWGTEHSSVVTSIRELELTMMMLIDNDTSFKQCTAEIWHWDRTWPLTSPAIWSRAYKKCFWPDF